MKDSKTTTTKTPGTTTNAFAVIYTRVSTAQQEEKGTSLPDQLARCRAYAQRLGLTALAELSEDMTGAVLERPELTRALALIESGAASTLILASVDRLSRTLEHQQAILRRVGAAGGRCVFADLPLPDTSEGRFVVGIMGGYAQYEREVISGRTKRGKIARAMSGKQVTVRYAPWGYHIVSKRDVLSGAYPAGTDGTYQIIEERAALVRDLFARYAAGETLGEICSDLNRRGVPTPQGKVWYRTTLSSILRNPAYKGEATYTPGGKKKGHTPIIIPCTPIISPEVWEKCEARRAGNKALSGPREQRYMLTGLVKCAVCGRTCSCDRAKVGTSGDKAAGFLRWRCRGRYLMTPGNPQCSNSKYVRDDVIQSALRRLLAVAFGAPQAISEAFAAVQTPQKPDIDLVAQQEELKRLTAQKGRIERAHLDAVGAGSDGSLYLEEIGRLSRQIAQLELALAERPKRDSTRTLTELLARLSLFPSEVLDNPDLTDAEKGRFVAALWDAITLRGDKVEFTVFDGPTVGRVLRSS